VKIPRISPIRDHITRAPQPGRSADSTLFGERGTSKKGGLSGRPLHWNL